MAIEALQSKLNSALVVNGAGDYALRVMIEGDQTLANLTLTGTLDVTGVSTFTGGTRIPNNVAFAMQRTQGGASFLEILKVDAGDDLIIGSETLDDMIFRVGSVATAMTITQSTGAVDVVGDFTAGTIGADDGASFGPSDITTITVVNGIVTAIA